MKTIGKLLFPVTENKQASLILLAARIIFGVLLLSHGLQKWSNFDSLSETFADPLGVGSKFSLILAIFGEVICSLGFITGFLFRLSIIPMAFTMCIAFFVIHGGDPLSSRELSLVYLIIFILMFFAGPGKFSIDYFIGKKLNK